MGSGRGGNGPSRERRSRVSLVPLGRVGNCLLANPKSCFRFRRKGSITFVGWTRSYYEEQNDKPFVHRGSSRSYGPLFRQSTHSLRSFEDVLVPKPSTPPEDPGSTRTRGPTTRSLLLFVSTFDLLPPTTYSLV